MVKSNKYYPLYLYLSKKKNNIIELKFDAIRNILGYSLPASASQRQWWSNCVDSGHSQSHSWIDAGFFASLNQAKKETVAFKRFK